MRVRFITRYTHNYTMYYCVITFLTDKFDSRDAHNTMDTKGYRVWLVRLIWDTLSMLKHNNGQNCSNSFL